MPPEVSSWWYQPPPSTAFQLPTTTLLGGYEFSCPSLYYTAFSSTALDFKTTAIGCCPSSYTFNGQTTFPASIPNQCFSDVPAGELTFAQLLSQGIYTLTSQNFEAFKIGGVQVNGFIFKNTAATTTSNPTGISTSKPAGNTSTPTDTLQSPNTGNSGLSSGAKAGIGIGVALVAVVALIVGVLLFRRKRRSATTNIAPPVEQGQSYHNAEAGINGPPEKKGPGSLTEPAELTAAERTQELDGGSNHGNLEHPHELA